jgi:hypothetical protein
MLPTVQQITKRESCPAFKQPIRLIGNKMCNLTKVDIMEGETWPHLSLLVAELLATLERCDTLAAQRRGIPVHIIHVATERW